MRGQKIRECFYDDSDGIFNGILFIVSRADNTYVNTSH